MSLRARLTLLYVAIAATAVIGLGVTAYVVARSATLTSVDRGLESDVRAVEASFDHLQGAISNTDIEQSRFALDRQAVDGLLFQIRDPSGTILYSSAGSAALSSSQEVGAEPGWRTVAIAEEDVRILIEPVVRFGEVIGTIEVRTSLAQAYASINSTRNVLIVGGVLTVLLSAAAAFVVAGHAAKPVRALAELAHEIEETADFTRRLPDEPSSREMREMALTFNRMIDRVEAMISTQRHFLSDTSHELRRPLTILRTDIDILTEPQLSAEDLAAVQTEMRTAATAMSTLVTELLILARQDEDPLTYETLDFNSLCRTALQTVAAMFERHSFEFHAPNVVWVVGDRQRLERMVNNIVLNAATYSPAPATVQCTLLVNSGRVHLTIKDSGPGISPDDLAHVFDRFYRGSTGRHLRPEGSGLGLAIVKQVAESHGGDVVVTSEEGSGTTVTVELPASSPME